MGVDVLAIFLLLSQRLYLVEVLEAGALRAVFDLGLPMLCLIGLLPDPIDEHLADDLVLDVVFNELLLVKGK